MPLIAMVLLLAPAQPRYAYGPPCPPDEQACLQAAQAFERLDASYLQAQRVTLTGSADEVNAALQRLVGLLNEMRAQTEAVVASGHPTYVALAYSRLGLAFERAADQIAAVALPEQAPDLDQQVAQLSGSIRQQAHGFLAEAGGRSRRLQLYNAITSPALLRAIALGLISPD